MNKLRTLIVDDEDLARRGLELRLERRDGIEVCGQARNGREALLAVRSQRPDVIFLDIQMPGMSGFEVLERIAGADMPAVIFVTAYDKFAIRAFEASALDYLLKPCVPLKSIVLTICSSLSTRSVWTRRSSVRAAGSASAWLPNIGTGCCD